ncbi:tetratricopeptide repeat protein [Sphingomonas flavescens]|uniref:tetratricopeptide repeat protein n=1 Tax=Sphingomonas flavescens TaxID=3132797 RepID=UPI00280643E9|nr:tetratricopeptide repeat protein [Sphingomonas limnosediminicola]
MKLFSTTALALAFVSAAPAAAQNKAPAAQAAATAPAKVTPSKKATPALIELQTAVQKKDWASVPAKIAAAQAVASTKEDRYLIGKFQLEAAVAQNDNNAAATAIEAMASSGQLGAAESSSLYQSLGGTFFNAKDFPRSVTAYQKALSLNPNNADAQSMLIEAYLSAGQKAEAGAALQRVIQARTAAGQKPDESLLKRAVAIAYDTKAPNAVEVARQWVAAYPSPASWSDALAIYNNVRQPDVEGVIDMSRLLLATNAMQRGDQYARYARAAAEVNNFNEAQLAYDAGVKANKINPTAADYSDLSSGLKAKQKATAADLAEATKTAQSGMALLRIGDRYYAMGDYSKAVELYRKAMGKPGVDTSVANLHIGMALARAGDKAGAKTALDAVTGTYADLAKFWQLYLSTAV